MLPRAVVPRSLVLLASRQGGVVTREQILAAGLTRHVVQRLVESGRWRRMAPGVFHAVAVDPPWAAWVWAGSLIGGERSRIGGRAALRLAGVPRAVLPVPVRGARITVLIPIDERRRVAGPWSFRQDQPGFREPVRVGAPARISVGDAVLDVVTELEAESEVVGLVTGVVQARSISADRLARRLEQRSRMRHRSLLVDVLGEVVAGVRSPLELRYLREVERAHRLPTGVRQLRRRGTECDIAYEDFALLIELDGVRGHNSEGAFRDLARDNRATTDGLARDNRATTDGLATLRYGWRDVVGRPCEVAAQVADNLRRRGWTGTPAPCASCRRAA